MSIWTCTHRKRDTLNNVVRHVVFNAQPRGVAAATAHCNNAAPSPIFCVPFACLVTPVQRTMPRRDARSHHKGGGGRVLNDFSLTTSRHSARAGVTILVSPNDRPSIYRIYTDKYCLSRPADRRSTCPPWNTPRTTSTRARDVEGKYVHACPGK